jgi:hypothetical protein
MTIAGNSERRLATLLAILLGAAIPLLGASWALAPAPAAAMVNQEEESPCADEADWFFFDDVGDECSEEGSRGASEGGDSGGWGSSDEDDGYYDDTGDPCADYGECWDEWDDSGDDDISIAEEDHDGRALTREDEEVSALEAALSDASHRWERCVDLDVEWKHAKEVLGALAEVDALGGDGVSEQTEAWRERSSTIELELGACVRGVNAALRMIGDARVRLGLPRREGRLFFKDEEDVEAALGFAKRLGATQAVAAPPTAATGSTQLLRAPGAPDRRVGSAPPTTGSKSIRKSAPKKKARRRAARASARR